MGPQTVDEAYVQSLGAGCSCSTTPNPQPGAPGACDGDQSTSSGTPMPSAGEPWLSQADPGCARQNLQPQYGYQLGPPHRVVSVAAPQW